MSTERAYLAAIENATPNAPLTVAAAGATQGGATAIVQSLPKLRVFVTVTTSSEGIKLPTPTAIGQELMIIAPTAKGVKVYPHTNGQINATSTNTAVALALAKSCTYVATSLTVWRTQLSA